MNSIEQSEPGIKSKINNPKRTGDNIQVIKKENWQARYNTECGS